MPTKRLTARQQDKLIEAAQNAIQFTVTGSGRFPLDMLRYDLCWPANSDESLDIEDALDSAVRLKERTITLKGLKLPTEPRWRSWGWRVVES
jgi:hypothetical protein